MALSKKNTRRHQSQADASGPVGRPTATSRGTFLGMGGLGGIGSMGMSNMGMTRSTTLSVDGSARETKEQRRIARDQTKVKRTIGAFALWIALCMRHCRSISLLAKQASERSQTTTIAACCTALNAAVGT